MTPQPPQTSPTPGPAGEAGFTPTPQKLWSEGQRFTRPVYAPVHKIFWWVERGKVKYVGGRTDRVVSPNYFNTIPAFEAAIASGELVPVDAPASRAEETEKSALSHQIMNLPTPGTAVIASLHKARVTDAVVPPENLLLAYRVGHRDARHAAAELADSLPAPVPPVSSSERASNPTPDEYRALAKAAGCEVVDFGYCRAMLADHAKSGGVETFDRVLSFAVAQSASLAAAKAENERQWQSVDDNPPPIGERVECYGRGWSSVPQGWVGQTGEWRVWFGSEVMRLRPDIWRPLTDFKTARAVLATPAPAETEGGEGNG